MSGNIIEIENASVYRDGKEVLHDFSWSIARGQHSFILGPNGAGKSTLVKLLIGHLYPAFGGKIKVLGRVFGKDNICEMRRYIALASPVLLDFQLGSFTVKELVFSGFDSTIGVFREITPQEEKRAANVMEKLGVSAFADRNFQTLSSGEQMRVLICRALVMEPELLILDEPCVFLDPAGREELLKTVNSLAQTSPGITILFITQRISDLLPMFSSGLLLSEGRIFARGNAEQLLTEEKLSRLFKIDLQLIDGKNGRKWSVCR